MHRAATVFALLALSGSALAADPLDVRLPRMQIMPGMEARWVGERMAVNGIPTRVREFTAPAAPAEVVAWYRRAWTSEGLADVLHTREGHAEVLAVGFRRFFQTLRVEPTGFGSRGTLTMSTEPKNSAIVLETDFPLPPLSAVITRIEALDAGQRSETVQAITRNSFWYARDHIIHALLDRGWTSLPLQKPQALPDEMELLQFQRESQHVQVSLQGEVAGKPNHTFIYVQWLK